MTLQASYWSQQWNLVDRGQWYNRDITQAGGVNSGSLFLNLHLYQTLTDKECHFKNFCAKLCCKNWFVCKV
jgi:hypothetical protein